MGYSIHQSLLMKSVKKEPTRQFKETASCSAFSVKIKEGLFTIPQGGGRERI
jgi:hypothetical protein